MMKAVLLAIMVTLTLGGLQKKASPNKAVASGPWHYYGRLASHEECVKQCPLKLIEERREYDGSAGSYMCLFAVSKTWYTMGVSRAFNCYHLRALNRAYPGMKYEPNEKYYGFEDGAYYDSDRCLAECRENCWHEDGTNYSYCVWTTNQSYQ